MILEGCQMNGTSLVEMYGPVERMGASFLSRMVRKTKNVVKDAGGVVARNARNIAVAATAIPTGGASLLAKKNVRDAVGNAASFTSRNIIRPVVNSSLVKTAVSSAIQGFTPSGKAGLLSSFLPGGGGGADSLSRTVRNAAGKMASPRRAGTSFIPTPTADAGGGVPQRDLTVPLIAGAAGVGLLILVLATQGNKQS